ENNNDWYSRNKKQHHAIITNRFLRFHLILVPSFD
ncbi:MAG: hypothetical protein ACI9A2_004402, partial [Halioglobus sp.]